METQVEKVYVAIGNDIQDGYKTLAWTLRKWDSQPISIVLLHVTYNISKEFLYTPCIVSEEKLNVLKKYEKEKTDKLLSKYIAFCDKVKVEVLKVEKNDEPIHKVIVDLMSGLRIGKLVIGMTFMKSSPWRSKSAISESFYVHQHKPDFSEFYIICEGKLVVLKGYVDEGFMEDVQGKKLREKPSSLKNLFGRIFSENNSPIRPKKGSCPPSSNQDSPKNQWENNLQELESYFQHLLSLNFDEEDSPEEKIIDNDDRLQASPMEPVAPDNTNSNMKATGKMGALQNKIDEAYKTIQLKKEEANSNAERQAKAEWAIILSNTRVEELETLIKEEVTRRLEIKKISDTEKEQLHEVMREVEDSKNKLNSVLELQAELSRKLQISSMARANVEAQLEKAVVTRAEMVREIEELRRQRNVLQRRVEFCKEKDALGTVARSTELLLSCSRKEYSAEDIRLATDGFSESLRLKSGGDRLNVYRGRINHSTVAIKMLSSANGLSHEDFQAKVRLLNEIRHPHLVSVMGFCSELKCVVFEYMHNGNLRDKLYTSQRSYRKARKNRVIGWYDRIRIAHEVCSGLVFLHSARPRPIFHGQLTASNVLLDQNLVAKISGYGLTEHHEQHYDLRSDIGAFGVLLMHLLTGRNWAGLVEESMAVEPDALVRVLDDKAGKWPLDLAVELAGLSMKCLTVVNRGPSIDMQIATVMEGLDELKKKADDLITKGKIAVVMSNENVQNIAEDSSDVPGVFLCPIYQEVMKNPHVAADGFSYELEAIEEWLKMGHDTSPMTNLSLKHKFLTPNHTLRSLIQEWQNKGSNLPC